MIVKPPRLIGAPAFHPVAAGFARRRTVADEFRPVVAGQYLRTPHEINPTEFTFLAPPAPTAEYRLSVNVSPRLIWQVMNPLDERTFSTFERAANTVESDPMINNLPIEIPPPAQHEAASISPPDRARSGPQQPSTVTDRFMMLREIAHCVVSTAASFMNSNDVSRTPGASRLASVIQQVNGFAPLSLTFQSDLSFSSRVADPGSALPQTHGWHGFFAERPVNERGTDRAQQARWLPEHSFPNTRWHTSRNDRGQLLLSVGNRVVPNVAFLVSPLARRVAERFAADFAPPGHELIDRRPDVRTRVAQVPGFGAIAAIGMHRPADLVPVIYRTLPGDYQAQAEQGANATGLLGGAPAAGAFALAVTSRHVRSEGSLSSPTAATPVTTVVRAAASSPARSPQNETVDLSSQSLPPRWNSAPAPPALPPDLMQQLTEQVVRALDSRALAARERAGRF